MVIAVALVIWYRTQTFIGNHSITDSGIQDGVHRLTARRAHYTMDVIAGALAAWFAADMAARLAPSVDNGLRCF